MRLTKPQRLALEILAERSPLTSSEFSSKMWPNTTGNHNGPWGLVPGGAIHSKGGQFMRSLERKGWVYDCSTQPQYALWTLSAAGRAAVRGDGESNE